MGIREILLHIDADEQTETGRQRIGYALSLASRFDAHVTGLLFALDPFVPSTVLGEVPISLIDQQRESNRKLARAAAEAFRQEADRAGISHAVRVSECTEGEALQILASQGRVSDLIMTGQREPDDRLPIREILIETALFETGRPSLIVPYIGPSEAKLDCVAVAWDGRREAARAVHDAMPILKRAKRVCIVTVGCIGTAKGEDPGADLAEALARHDLDVELQHLDATQDIAGTLLSNAADRGFDLMVMGGYSHSRLREIVLGGATRGILESMTVPVLMSH
ncbi:universal stress protein [Lutibaculum baratangense]|uniref:Universal stress protein UspA n=1 Tax=Lutibaculum baratangense AMV1 TaxID=631454 RepID=V4RMH1_9HYPH|nr:universal stress protein [Lutibaculum baratangense]ESR26469.1 Universal stress protein UspA [Lutibaculum baratangense AMV1]